MRRTPTIPPPPNMPTIPDHPPPVSVRYGGLRVAIPAVLVSSLVSAAASAFVMRQAVAVPVQGDAVAELRGDVKALSATVTALAQAQRDTLERINRDADARSNAALVDALKARGGAP